MKQTDLLTHVASCRMYQAGNGCMIYSYAAISGKQPLQQAKSIPLLFDWANRILVYKSSRTSSPQRRKNTF